MLDFGARYVDLHLLDAGLRHTSASISSAPAGRVEIEIPFNPPPDRPCRLWHQRGAEIKEIAFDTCDQYTIEGDLMSEAILNDTPVPTPLQDANSQHDRD